MEFIKKILIGFSFLFFFFTTDVLTAAADSPSLDEIYPQTIEFEGQVYHRGEIEKDPTKYQIVVPNAAGKIVTAKEKTQAMFTRSGESSPWTLYSETVITWTEFTYWTGYDAYYEITKVQYYGPSDSVQYPRVLKFEDRTYHYNGY